MKNNLSSYEEGNIKHPKKKFEKVVRVPPEGYESSNDFFEDVFMDKDMIWMGQNTNHLHGDIIADAMASCAKAKEYCKYPPPEGFSELKQLILDDLGFKNSDVLLTAGATESLYLCMQALLGPQDNVVMSDPGYLIIGNFANRFAGEVRYVPVYNEECGYKLTPELLRENMDENTKMVVLIDPLNPLGSGYTEEEIKEFAIKNNLINDNCSDEEIYDNFLSLDVSKEAIINQTKVIKKIANISNAVIIGRSADYILRENKNLIKIFIYASMDYKIENVMKNYGDNEKQAKNHILDSDKSRSNYYSAIANRNWGDKNNYDLCIDARIGNENVVKIICDYVKNK